MSSIAITPLQIALNGEARTVAARNVAELVHSLALDPRKVAIERNLAIVPRSDYATTALTEGDRIEIVSFIGGG